MAVRTHDAGKLEVTRDVEPAALRDLLEDPPRATVALLDHDRVDALPVRYRLDGGTHLIGVASEATVAIEGREVLLVIDDGAYWFELRGVSVRGVATRIDAPDGDRGGHAWYAIAPRRVLGWDYGAIRRV